jgi:thiamine transport system substrate-binding protein
MKRILIALLVAGVATGCSARPASEVTLLTHDSFLVSEDVLADFTAETGIAVNVVRAGDGGAMLNQAILTKDNPIADVLFGVDNTFLSRALSQDLFIPYRAAELRSVPVALREPTSHVTPIDYGDVCLNTDIAGLEAAGIDPPAELLDLVEPQYAGRLVVEDPSTSTPGLAFLLATIAVFGEEGDYPWQDYWRDLVANDLLITSGWEDAYYLEFSGGSSSGNRPIVVSYASSPMAEMYFNDLDEAPTGVVNEGCFRQIEYAGILAGTENRAEAMELLDFLLSIRFQEDIPLTMFVFPANSDAQLPAVFADNAVVPEHPVTVPPDEIDANREQWIREWAEIVR